MLGGSKLMRTIRISNLPGLMLLTVIVALGVNQWRQRQIWDKEVEKKYGDIMINYNYNSPTKKAKPPGSPPAASSSVGGSTVDGTGNAR
jgi:hypothetical protein